MSWERTLLTQLNTPGDLYRNTGGVSPRQTQASELD